MNDTEILQLLRNIHINDTCKGNRISVTLTRAIEALQEKNYRGEYEVFSADCDICKQITKDCEKGNGCTGFCALKVSGLNTEERQRMWEIRIYGGKSMSKYKVNVGGYVTVYRERTITVSADTQEEAEEKAIDKFVTLQQSGKKWADCSDGTINSIEPIN